MAKTGIGPHSQTAAFAYGRKSTNITRSIEPHTSQAERIALAMMDEKRKGRPPEATKPVTLRRFSWE